MVGELEETASASHVPVARKDFGTVQLWDLSLAYVWKKNIKVIDGVHQKSEFILLYPHFAVFYDFLCCLNKEQEQVVEQLLVSQSHMRMVLDLSHSNALFSHLGVKKTKK